MRLNKRHILVIQLFCLFLLVPSLSELLRGATGRVATWIELEWGEGVVFDNLMSISGREDFYPKTFEDSSVRINPYPPVFYIITRLIAGEVLDAKAAVLKYRKLNTFYLLILATVLFITAAKILRDHYSLPQTLLISTVLVSMFLSNKGILEWVSLIRVDILAALFLFLAIVCYLHESTLMASIFFVLTILTKQSLIGSLICILIFDALSKKNFRSDFVIRFCSFAFLASVATFFIFGNGIILHVVGSQLNSIDFNSGSTRVIYAIASNAPLIVMLNFLLFISKLEKRALFIALLNFSFALACIFNLKRGAVINHFIEYYLVVFLCAMYLVKDCSQLLEAKRTKYLAVIFIAIALFGSLNFYSNKKMIFTKEYNFKFKAAEAYLETRIVEKYQNRVFTENLIIQRMFSLPVRYQGFELNNFESLNKYTGKSVVDSIEKNKINSLVLEADLESLPPWDHRFSEELVQYLMRHYKKVQSIEGFYIYEKSI